MTAYNCFLDEKTFRLRFLSSTNRTGKRTKSNTYRDWFLVKYNPKGGAYSPKFFFKIPHHLIGKKIRLKVEVLDDSQIIKKSKNTCKNDMCGNKSTLLCSKCNIDVCKECYEKYDYNCPNCGGQIMINLEE